MQTKEENVNSEFSHIGLIDLGDGTYRIIFTITLPTQIPIRYFTSKNAQNEFCKNISFRTGYMKEILKKENILLTEIEVIMPPIAEYLDIQKRLTELMINNGYKSFRLSKGIIINVPISKSELDIFTQTIRKNLERLKEGSANDN